MDTRNRRPIPSRKTSHSLNNDICGFYLLSHLLALLVHDVEGERPLRSLFVPLCSSHLVEVANESIESVLCGDIFEVLTDLGTWGVESTPVVLYNRSERDRLSFSGTKGSCETYIRCESERVAVRGNLMIHWGQPEDKGRVSDSTHVASETRIAV